AQVYCWDGDNPGIAYYVPGSGNPPHMLPLPAGAQDPDIIVGREGLWGYVVYEMGTNIVLHEFTCSPPVATTLAFGSATILSTNGRHPNIDREIDCESAGSRIAIVYQNLSGTPDLEYYHGIFGGPFSGPVSVPTITFTQSGSRVYLDRINPDVNISRSGINSLIQFTTVGYEIISLFTHCVDYFDHVSTNHAPEDPLSVSNLEIHPRIDGYIDSTPLNNQLYYITVDDNNAVFFTHANALSPSWYDINISGTSAQKPVIAVHGDIADIIWSNDFLGSLNILGAEIHGTTHSSIYKDANSTITSGINLFYPSIAYNMCNKLTNLYAMCWWGEDQNIYFKAGRTPPSPAYRLPNPGTNLIFYKDKPEQNLRLLEHFEKDQPVAIQDISGKVIFRGNPHNAASFVHRFPQGVYVLTTKKGISKKLFVL
ncbi:MAG: hypothetical protein ACK4EX_11000, partial [Thermaurantimonas sp.]|uniref:hypothetical protein n=1 Tax=Thermaurantimonas sp. TaxID=2681568 RepID=UPI003919DF9B